MLDAKEVVKRAYNAASIDAKQKKIATEVLNILSSNGTTVSEAITILNAVEIFYKFKGYNEAATYIKYLTDPFYFEYKIDMLRFMDKPEIALEVIISDKNVENLTDFVKEIIAKKPKLLRKAKELADKNKVILNLD